MMIVRMNKNVQLLILRARQIESENVIEACSSLEVVEELIRQHLKLVLFMELKAGELGMRREMRTRMKVMRMMMRMMKGIRSLLHA